MPRGCPRFRAGCPCHPQLARETRHRSAALGRAAPLLFSAHLAGRQGGSWRRWPFPLGRGSRLGLFKRPMADFMLRHRCGVCTRALASLWGFSAQSDCCVVRGRLAACPTDAVADRDRMRAGPVCLWVRSHFLRGVHRLAGRPWCLAGHPWIGRREFRQGLDSPLQHESLAEIV